MENALHIDNLYVNYEQTPALSGVCLDVTDKEFLVILGPNGGGKTTLLKAILGLIPISSGNILVYGDESTKKRKTLIGYVPQISQADRKFPISLKDVVLTGMIKGPLHPFFRFNKHHEQKAYDLLSQVGLENLSSRQISQLSSGEFQRLLIARALATEPKIILLDEPTASVDPNFKDQFYELLEKLNKNMTIIMVSHDLMAISSNVKRIACLNIGMVYHGKPLLSEKIVHQLYGCPVDLIAHGVPHRVLREHKGEDNH